VYHAAPVTRPDRPYPLHRLAAALAATSILVAAGCAHAPGAPAPAPAAPTSPAAAAAPAAGQAGATGAAGPSGAAAPPGAAPAEADPLAPLRLQVDALLTAQAAAAWAGWVGDAALDLPAASQGRAALLEPAALARVDEARRAATGPAARAADQLHAFLLGERLARATATSTQALASARAAATFSWDKRKEPLRRLPFLLAAEPEGPRRKALAEAHDAAARALAPLVATREAALASAVGSLGFEGTLPLAAALRGAPVEALEALAEATLARTDATWRALLDALARKELSTPAERLRERDLPRLWRTAAESRAFPARRLLPDAEATLAGLGLDLAAGGRLVVDAAAHPGQIARPLCVPVEVPGQVRLAVPPVAGLDAARALFHELGVAQAAARITAPGLEARRLGSPALAGAWGRLLASVTADPAWLTAHGLEAEAARREARVAAARRLHEARRAAALVLAEVARARAPAGAAAAWARLGPRALGHPLDAGEAPPWRLEPDPLLESAEVLRAALLAAQVEARLGAGPGGPWWRRPQSGAWLREAWAHGAARTPDEVARDAGGAGLDPGALDVLVRAQAAAGGLELGVPGPPGPSSTTPPPGG